MLKIIIMATSPGRYAAALEDGTLLAKASATPFLNACRHLLELGHDPGEVVAMRHAGSEIDCLCAPIGVAAKLTVLETSNGPRFARWKAWPNESVKPGIDFRVHPVPPKGRLGLGSS